MNNKNQFAELVAAVGSCRKTSKLIGISKSRVNELSRGLGQPKEQYMKDLNFCVMTAIIAENLVNMFGSVTKTADFMGISRASVNRRRNLNFTAKGMRAAQKRSPIRAE